MKQNMLICGATGFIGRNLLEYFYSKNEFNIRAIYFEKDPIDHFEGVEWVKCDLRNQSEVKKIFHNIDIVLQYAATTSGAKDIISKPYIHVTDNAVINSILLREAFENNIKHFIFPSCSIMYQSSEHPITEDDFDISTPINDIYFGAGYTKVYLEKMCEFYSKFNKTKFTVIRQSNIYGPHDKFDLEKSHVFAASLVKVLNSKNGKIKIWGSGLEKRDLLYVADLCNFIDLALQKQSSFYELFNVGFGSSININDLVDKIIHHCKINIKVENDLDKPSIKTSISLNCKKAKDKLNWEPKISLDKGIIKTIEWYKKWHNTVIH